MCHKVQGPVDDQYQSKERWPDCAEQRLKQLMVEHKLFNYHKTNGESAQKMQAIVQDIRSVIDITDWVDGEHDELLRKKIGNKISRIRLVMRETGRLRDTDDGPIYQSPIDAPQSETLSIFESAAQQLEPVELAQAISILIKVFGHARVAEEAVKSVPHSTGKSFDRNRLCTMLTVFKTWMMLIIHLDRVTC